MTRQSWIAAIAAAMIIATGAVSVSCGKSDPSDPSTSSGTGNGSGDAGSGNTPDTYDATAARIDESFSIALGSEGAAFGSEGRICVYSKADDKLVDYVDFADMATVTLREDGQLVPKEQMTEKTIYNTMMQAIGPDGTTYRRIIHCTPVRIEGANLVFKPHAHKLEYDKEYYITADASIVSGVDFKGVAKDEMTFHTCKTPTLTNEIVVAQSGKSDFRTIQGAIDFSATMSRKETLTITVHKGLYREMLYLRNNNKITIKAAAGEEVELAYANCESWANGTGSSRAPEPSYGSQVGKHGGRAVILIESSDMVTFERMVLRNSFGSTAGQAEVFYNNDNSGNCRLIIKYCELWSYQDTFLTKGYAWIYKSLIAGHCDYIWGYPKTCLFEDCEIRSLAKGYIVQCRCQSAGDKGFVFLNCSLTAGEGVGSGTTTLARSAGQSTLYDNVTYVNCKMGSVVEKYGWHISPAPNPSKPTATSGWKEYGTMDLNGKALDTSGRATYGKVLTSDEAAPYLTRAAVFDGAPFADAAWLQ